MKILFLEKEAWEFCMNFITYIYYNLTYREKFEYIIPSVLKLPQYIKGLNNMSKVSVIFFFYFKKLSQNYLYIYVLKLCHLKSFLRVRI